MPTIQTLCVTPTSRQCIAQHVGNSSLLFWAETECQQQQCVYSVHLMRLLLEPPLLDEVDETVGGAVV
jgi:DNA-binding protein Fis